MFVVNGASIASEGCLSLPQIRDGINQATSDYDKDKLQERLAKLSGGVAVIKVRTVFRTLARQVLYTATRPSERQNWGILRCADVFSAEGSAVHSGHRFLLLGE